ncbi:hypothetical protein RF11_10026 [Thelohanellus kitauei]|uniref:Uncharacterized protein n=1 Tax=Thelohanellus kitauei TaxID=669202 RepID=A0A0C2JXS0_THEKT|nr:hypothetical protein RF11_10026 [Thelohanellus kitauei]
MDDLIMFQNIIFQGTSLLVCVLTELKDSSILLHICANLIKERHNTYMFEEDRMKLINICKEKIIHQLEDLVRLSKHDKSCDDKIILIAHKYYKLPPKIIKDYRARIIEILISFYTQTQHFSSLSSSSHDQKQLLEYATKYAGTLENKILQKH